MKITMLFLSALAFSLCYHGHAVCEDATREIQALPVREVERFPVVATWYGRAYAGRRTAAGWHLSPDVPRDLWRFDPSRMTAAHPTLPFGTRLRVTWLGRAVEVIVTDRTAPGVDVLDLSSAAFEALAPLRAGVLHVVAEVL